MTQLVKNRATRRSKAVLGGLLTALLAACGGGGGDAGEPTPPAADCSVASQKAWVGDWMDDWYFWYAISPRPDPSVYASVDEYYQALLYTGSSADFPADRWSTSESTESFNRFYGDGQTLGYGVSVAGIEVTGRPDLPLYVRHVEARSDAALQGVRRGDEVLAINGRSAASLIEADDFSLLSADAEGEQITLLLRRAGVDRSVTLRASVFTLTPVSGSATVLTPSGRRMGYVAVKDMISQAAAPLETAFAQFRAGGIDEVVIDLRYNGGGLVSVAGTLSSYVAGAAASGRPFATLLYNDKRAAANNQDFLFGNPVSAAGVSRVFVLTGPRTCSASEQVINGLRGVGVDVVAVGDTTCGKPVGFLPTSQCGTTYSAVNFESVNARFEGRYFDGFAPTCAASEDFGVEQGAAGDPLLVTAANYADTGACPVGATGARNTARALRAQGRPLVESDERQTMLPR